MPKKTKQDVAPIAQEAPDAAIPIDVKPEMTGPVVEPAVTVAAVETSEPAVAADPVIATLDAEAPARREVPAPMGPAPQIHAPGTPAPLPAPPPVRPGWRDLAARYGARAAALALALGLGYGLARATAQHPADSAYLVEATAGVRDSRQALARIGDEVAGLKTSLERVRQGVENPRADGARLAQTLDRLDQSSKDSGERIARLGEQLERAQRDPARVAALSDRFDRLEKQIAALAGAAKPATAPPVPGVPVAGKSPAADAVAQTGSIAKPAKLEGWVLRDVEDGVALIENSSGRLREVYSGQMLPGGIRVEGIERRGRAWVVVTSKGLISGN